MATKRNIDSSALSALVPVNKKSKNEIQLYSAKNRRADFRSSSLFAPIVLLSGHESEIFACKFSPDGNFVASAGFDRKIFLWNVYGECENWAILLGHGGAVMDLRFTLDSSEIISCATDKSIMIWNLETLERVKKLKGHENFVNCIDVSRQTPQKICSGGDDNKIKLWDRRKRGEALMFDSGVQVLAVAFNEQADQLISGGIDNDIKVWDVRKNALLYKMKGHSDCPTGLSLSPDGAYVASNAMDSTVRIWDIRPYAAQERCTKIFYGHTHNFEKVFSFFVSELNKNKIICYFLNIEFTACCMVT